MNTSSLSGAVQSLRQFLADSAAQGATTPEKVRERASQTNFPYPELAAQVVKFLKTTPSTGLAEQLTKENISDAFMTLLMDADAAEALGGGQVKNPWLNVRQVLRSTGANLGAGLIDVYNIVRQTGLGYTPTIMELAGLLAAMVKDAKGQGADALAQLAQQRGLAPWQIALLQVWLRRRRSEGAVPTDADLEEIFADTQLVAELQQTEGPWEVYVHQGATLRTLRHFGEGLDALADALEDT